MCRKAGPATKAVEALTPIEKNELMPFLPVFRLHNGEIIDIDFDDGRPVSDYCAIKVAKENGYRGSLCDRLSEHQA